MQWVKGEIVFTTPKEKLTQLPQVLRLEWFVLLLFNHEEEEDMLEAILTVEAAMVERDLVFMANLHAVPGES